VALASVPQQATTKTESLSIATLPGASSEEARPSGARLESKSIAEERRGLESTHATQLLMEEPSETRLENSSITPDSAEVARYPKTHEDFLYGSQQQEQAMRKWLDDNRLPQIVADEFLDLGIRNIQEVVELVKFSSELLDDMNIKKFDRIKLQRAVKALQNA